MFYYFLSFFTFSVYYCCAGVTLWRGQKFLQCILVEFSLHHSPLSPFPRSWNSLKRSHFSVFIHVCTAFAPQSLSDLCLSYFISWWGGELFFESDPYPCVGVSVSLWAPWAWPLKVSGSLPPQRFPFIALNSTKTFSANSSLLLKARAKCTGSEGDD
jgi:hypothetical protein